MVVIYWKTFDGRLKKSNMVFSSAEYAKSVMTKWGYNEYQYTIGRYRRGI